MATTRREALAGAAGMGLMLAAGGEGLGASAAVRRFHYSVDGALIDAEPTMLPYLRASGVTDLWLGWWVSATPPNDEQMRLMTGWKSRIEAAGMAAHMILVPLGHPGEGPKQPRFPVDGHWGVRPDGSTYAGTAFHPPVLRDTAAALERFRPAAFRRWFLDDDFRVAQSPFDIGGCFCPQHQATFLKRYGLAEGRWPELLEAVAKRQPTALLKQWIEFTCDELTGCFRSMRTAAGKGVDMGVMVMYLGCERAGIGLPDYRGVPFRVGELMFEDAGFNPVKGKTDELYGVLFHRRFVRPDMAYSETTAYPPERLSPRNGAAKLCTSTLADVRNTMMMCMNLADWERRSPGLMSSAMRKHARLHQAVAGHTPRGPFKHFYGDASRLVGGDWPYSLFLALGVPFEVTAKPSAGGWTFLSDADAQAAAAGRLKSPGTAFICRPGKADGPACRPVADDLDVLFALRRSLLPKLAAVPHVEEELPVVCAWYPTARAVLLWNLQEQPVEITLRHGGVRRPVRIGPLDMELVEGLAAGRPTV